MTLKNSIAEIWDRGGRIWLIVFAASALALALFNYYQLNNWWCLVAIVVLTFAWFHKPVVYVVQSQTKGE